MKIGEPNYNSVEDALDAIKKGYADLVGYYVYKGYGLNSLDVVWSIIDLTIQEINHEILNDKEIN